MAAELLTLAEYKQILSATPFKDFHLIDYEIFADNEAPGFLGEYYRLFLHCREGHQNVRLSFFVKSLPLNSAEAEKSNIFRKETELYNTLLTDLQFYSSKQWSPKCYYTRPHLMVLQDLNSLNYESCRHNEENLTKDELQAILSALARLHSSSIALEEIQGSRIDTLYSSSMLDEITVAPHVSWFRTGIKTMIDLAKIHRNYQSPEAQSFITNELETRFSTVYEMQNPSAKYRNVLCHRDPWRANSLFNYSEMSVALVDFQTCRYCPPSIDLILAIFLNQSKEARNQFEDQYLLWYYEKFKSELNQHGIDAGVCLTFDEIASSYGDFKLFGLLYGAITMTITEVPKEIVTDHYKYVDRTKQLSSLMKSDIHFRNRIEDKVSELLDYIMNENKD